MEERESSERKSLLIRTIIIIILLLLSFLATILYVYMYPKTRIELYDSDYNVINSFEVKRYSTLNNLKGIEKVGYTFDYWSYDDFGGRKLDPNAELKTEVLRLYANYTVNRYKITYHIQYFDETNQQYQYKTYYPYGYYDSYDYGSEIILPTGRMGGELLPEFTNMHGYHFVGWTTKVLSEDDPDVEKYMTNAGAKFVLDIPSNIDFYAYFEKNTFALNLHTGIQYQMDSSNNPMKDENGNYIIKNNPNATIDNDGLLVDTVRYQDLLTTTTDKYNNITLTEKNAGMAYGEYEFLGWYLDPDYLVAVDDYQLVLNVATNGRPYYSYNDGNAIQTIWGIDTGNRDVDGNIIYEFNVYSKWQRKAYEISFNKNSNHSNGKITPIHLYKVFLDENGNIIDEYGSYYDDGEFTYEGYANGGHYCRVNLESLDVVDEAFRNSNSRYRLIRWTNKNIDSQSTEKYAVWQQQVDKPTAELVKARITSPAIYTNSIYTHTTSGDYMLFAQWSEIFVIKFAYAGGSNQKYFTYEGIKDEWFVLPTSKRIEEEGWTKLYSYFAGWQQAGKIIEEFSTNKETGAEENASDYYCKISNSSTYYAYWRNTPYIIKFHLNDGTDDVKEISAYGGNVKNYIASPVRDGYIFDGWSKTKYQNANDYAKARRQAKNESRNLSVEETAYLSSSNFRVEGGVQEDANKRTLTLEFYGSWTKNFVIEYDLDGGTKVGSTKLEYNYSDLIGSASHLDLKASIYIGKAISVKKEHFVHKGWKLKNVDNGEVFAKSTSSKRTIFDFFDNKYYDYVSSSITVPESKKKPFAGPTENVDRVVLVSIWEAEKYDVTIIDTLANEGNTPDKNVIKVAYNEPFKFPETNTLGDRYDSKIGFQLKGFAFSRDGEIIYPVVDGRMPDDIPAFTISAPMTLYTIYVQKKINLEYKFYKYSGDTLTEENYIPENTSCTQPGKVDYGQELILPVVTGEDYGNIKFKFIKWFYLDESDIDKPFEERERHEVVTGSKIIYHDSKDTLTLYAEFKVESYEIMLQLTNPFNNNSVIDTISLCELEKNSKVEVDIYNGILNQVYAHIAEKLGDYLISYEGSDGQTITLEGILKGYYLKCLNATGSGYSNEFKANKYLNATDFNVLITNTNKLILVPEWIANDIDLVYSSSEEEGAITQTKTFKFNDQISLESSSLFNLGSIKIKSWYINIDGKKQYFACNSIFSGSQERPNLHNLINDIDWNILNGKGTLKIYANTQQICTVNYYYFDYNTNTITLKNTVEFPLGDTVELMNGSELNYKDLKFAGWYYNGALFNGDVAELITSEHNYTVDLYANMAFKKSVYSVNIESGVSTSILISQDDINILTFVNGTPKYLTALEINTLPTLDSIPEGYNYYGLMSNNKVFKANSDNTIEMVLSLDGTDIIIEAYFTKEYTIVYTLNESDQSFADDGTTAERLDTFQIGSDGKIVYNGNFVESITIKYNVNKNLYNFVGWNVLNSNGTINTEIGVLGGTTGRNLIPTSLLSNVITLVPNFSEPEVDTINVQIWLYRTGAEGETPVVIEKKNGGKYTFVQGKNVNASWENQLFELYRWKSLDYGTSGYNVQQYYEVGEVLNIPNAIEENKIFKFAGEWIEKYQIKFIQPENYSSATGYPNDPNNPIILKKGEEYLVEGTPVIDGGAVTFKYWVLDGILDENGKEIIVNTGDIIIPNENGSATYRKLISIKEDGQVVTKHYLPKRESNIYKFVGAWQSVIYTIAINITNPKDNTIAYTLIKEVEFGSTFETREIIDADTLQKLINDGFETDDRGIVGWSTTNGGSVSADILKDIRSNFTLYSVWQSKNELKFNVTEDIEYDSNIIEANGKTIPAIKFLPGDTININKFIKSIYKKGYVTVYFDGNKYAIVAGANNDYYILTGFSSSAELFNAKGQSIGNKISVSNEGTIDVFTAKTDVVLTPIFERTYSVSFYDNTTTSGGNQTTIENVYLRENETLDLTKYTYQRENFTFLGWSLSIDVMLGTNTITMGVDCTLENHIVYAVWASNRKVRFQISTTNSTGITNKLILEYPLTKDNKINTDIIQSYLNGADVSNNAVVSYNLEKNEKLSTMGHPAYIYNFNDYYLDGFLIGGNAYTLSTLASTTFDGSENVVVTLNFRDIFKINYLAENDGDIKGELNVIDYFVVLDQTRYGKLTDNGAIVELTIMPKEDIPVTKPHNVPRGFATGAQVDTIEYDYTNELSLKIGYEKLQLISRNLMANYLQTYTLYLQWEYEYLTTYVYAITENFENEDSETILKNPYESYVNSKDGTDIKFSVVANMIYIDNQARFIGGNYRFNKENPDKPVLRYNDIFTLKASTKTNIGGYVLIGFSTKLFKLGQVPDAEEYYTLGSYIQLNDELLGENTELKLYPVYVLENKNILISAINGKAEVKGYYTLDKDLSDAGFVYVPDITTNEFTIEANSANWVVVSTNLKLVITAIEPMNSAYMFKEFVGFGTTEDAAPNIRTIMCSEFWLDEDLSNELQVVYGTSSVKLNITLKYPNELKNLSDNGEFTISGQDSVGNSYNQIFNTNNRNSQVIVESLASINYVINTSSTYFDYVLYNGATLENTITLVDGKKINVGDLTLKDVDEVGNYLADIVVVAVPKSYRVTFIMNRGSLKSGTEISATNSIFENVSSFKIENGVVRVFMGSTITLPTAENITYTNAKFVCFYLNGDADKTPVISKLIDSDTTFVELYDDNVFSIQYVYMGNSTTVTGIEPGATATIGIDAARLIDGYNLLGWSLTPNGNIDFVDGAEVVIEKSYILYAIYSGEAITINYTYIDADGNEKTISKTAQNGQNIILITFDHLTNPMEYDTKYLFGWERNDVTFEAGKEVLFKDLGFVYSADNTTINFVAKYYNRYKYIISYDTSTVENAQDYSDIVWYVRTNNEDGSSYNTNDLMVKISSIEPVSNTTNATYFDYYMVKILVDGEYVDDTSANNSKIVVGSQLTLKAPTNIDEVIKYQLVPVFRNTTTSIKINYTITRPDTNESINDINTTDEKLLNSIISDISFSANKLLDDEYLPRVTTAPNVFTSNWTLSKQTFSLTIDGLDWHKYQLVGYTINLYDATKTLIGTRTMKVGQEIGENISGASIAEISTIWEQKYVIYYFDQNNAEVVDMRSYIEFDNAMAKLPLASKPSDTSAFTLSNYMFVGWTTVSDNNHIISNLNDYVMFDGELSIGSSRDINLYPAQSKLYTINFVTTNIDGEDLNNFEFANYTKPQIYLGINVDNSIDLSGYLPKIVYSKYNSDKYDFVGFSGTQDVSSAKLSYKFDVANIQGEYINVYAMWQKKSYTIAFEFDAPNKSGVNVLRGIEFILNKYHGDQINLKYSYDENTNEYTFAGVETLDNGTINLQEVINANMQEMNIDYLKLTKIKNSNGEEIDINNLYTILQSQTITLVFEPIYRVSYILPLNAGYKENDTSIIAETSEIRLPNETIVVLGSNINCIYDYKNISCDGYAYEFWTLDGTTNFFDGNSHTITLSDIDNCSDDYRIRLNLKYSTAYTINVYYLDSKENFEKFQAIENPTQEDFDKYYSLLVGNLSLTRGDRLLLEKDGVYPELYDVDTVSILDSILADGHKSVNLGTSSKTITKFSDLFKLFDQYITDGLLKINGNSDVYSVAEYSMCDYQAYVYEAKTYGGSDNPLINNLYLTYVEVPHAISLISTVAKFDDEHNLIFDETTDADNLAFAEYAVNSEQLNDDGKTDVMYPRGIASKQGTTEYLSFTENVYLFNAEYFVRMIDFNKSYIFQSWKVLSWTTATDSEGNQTYNYFFQTPSEAGLTVTEIKDESTNVVQYLQVTGFKKDTILVAVFTENLVDVTVTIKSVDGFGDKLDLKLTGRKNEVIDTTNLTTRDSANQTTTYELKLLYETYLGLDVLDSLKDKYEIQKFTIGISDFEMKSYALFLNDAMLTDNKFDITVLYGPIQYTLNMNVSTNIQNSKISGTLDSIEYQIVTTDGSIVYATSQATAVSDSAYNIQAKIPVGAKIYGYPNAHVLGIPTLNNYRFLGWQYVSGGNKVFLGTDGISVDELVFDKEIMLEAVFEPIEIEIRYVIKETLADGGVIKNIITGVPAPTGLKYGDNLKLPTVVVQKGNLITTGYELGSFGQEVSLAYRENPALEYNENKLIFEVILQTANVYFISYSAGKTGFDISEYTALNGKQMLSEYPIDIEAGKTYYYANATTEEIVAEARTDGFSIGMGFNIPNLTIGAGSSKYEFGGWVSKLNTMYELVEDTETNETYYGPYYLAEEDAEDDGHTIILTAGLSNSVIVEFKITDPNNINNSYMLTTSPTVEANIDSIKLVITEEEGYDSQYVDLNSLESKNTWTAIDVVDSTGTSTLRYFANQSLKDDFKLFGWSTEPHVAYSDIVGSILESENLYGNSGSKVKYYSMYTITDSACSKKSSSIIAQEFKNFVSSLENTTLYPIWEQKIEVEFEYEDKFSQSQKYGYGELVVAPNPNDENTSVISNGTNKWIGWRLSDSTWHPFSSNMLSFYFVGNSKQTWQPEWKQGYTLTFDTNFNRSDYADIFSKYGSQSDTIKSNMGYPYFSENDLRFANLSNYGESVKLGNKIYSSAYRYGTLWTENEELDLSGLELMDNGIYPTNITLRNGISINNSYLKFVGWSLDKNGTAESIIEDMSNFKLTENTTLYAVWQAVEFKVYLYLNKESAENNQAIESPLEELAVDFVGIPFGSKFNVSDIDDIFKTNKEMAAKVYKDGFKFDHWNVCSPITRSDLTNSEGGIPLICNLFMYPEYIDAYKVVFKNSINGENLVGQEDNYLIVVNGDTIAVKDYLLNTLNQNYNMITKISYFNKSGTEVIIKDGNTDNTKIVFNLSNSLVSTNKEFVIYVAIEFKLNLYAPKKATASEYENTNTITIAPEYSYTIKRNNKLVNEFVFDVNTYYSNSDIQMKGWYYYGANAENDKFKMSNVGDSINRLQVILDENKNYKILLFTDNNLDGIEYNLAVGSNQIDLYAKLTITNQITIGQNDELAYKFAKLSYVSNDYIQAYVGTNGNVRTINYTVVYGSAKETKFIIETEGYLVNQVNGLEDYEYTLSTKTDYTCEKGNYRVSQSIRDYDDNTSSNGMFVTYNIIIKGLTKNTNYFVEIVPYTIDVSYVMNSDEGFIYHNLDGTGSIKESFDKSKTVNVFADKDIYQIAENGKGYVDRNCTINVEYKVEGNITTITYKNVPYGMSIYTTPNPKQELYMHFDGINLWKTQTWNITQINQSYKGADLEYNNQIIKLTYKPNISTSENALEKNYSLELLFEKNVINAVNLKLDYDAITPADGSEDAWVNAIKTTPNDNKKEMITYTSTIDNKTVETSKYILTWQTKAGDGFVVNGQQLKAGDNIQEKLNDLIVEYHEAFDEKLDSNEILGGTLTLNQMLSYFMLADGAEWKTFAKTETDGKGQGYLKTNKAESTALIYGLHNSTVDLHIDLRRAFLTNVDSRVLDYTATESQVIETNIRRALVGAELKDASFEKYVYVSDDARKNDYDRTYTNELKNSLIIKAPYGSDFKIKVSPVTATSDHTKYVLKHWTIIDTTNNSTDGTKDQVTLTVNTSVSNNGFENDFADFKGFSSSGQDTGKLPDIRYRADVVADTYNVKFFNAKDSKGESKEIKTLAIAYDKGIADIRVNGTNKYYYYNYNLGNLYSSEKHIMPRFSLACDDSFKGDKEDKFAYPGESIDSSYGDIKYLFKHWATLVEDNYSIYNKIASLINYSNDYNDITLYAGYNIAQEIKFLRLEANDDSYTEQKVYIADKEFSDQFGIKYDNNLNTDSLNAWSEKINCLTETKSGGAKQFMYFLMGNTNASSVQVYSLQEIKDAYNNASYDLAEKNYVVYPAIRIGLQTYKHKTDNESNLKYTSLSYVTLGGKITFSMKAENKDTKLYLTNVITNLQLDGYETTDILTTHAKDFQNYSFAMWYVGKSRVVPGQDISCISTENVYEHYNARVKIEQSSMGSSKLVQNSDFEGNELENGVELDSNSVFSLLASPSYAYICENGDTPIQIKYTSNQISADNHLSGTLQINLMKIDGDYGIDRVLYTIKFAANKTIDEYAKIGFRITTANGTGIKTLNSVNDVYYIDDQNGSVFIEPVAYPKTVKVVLDPFVIENFPDDMKNNYNKAFDENIKQLVVEGGAKLLATIKNASSSKPVANLDFQTMSGTKINGFELEGEDFDDLKGNIVNLRWQYSDGKNWYDVIDIYTTKFEASLDGCMHVRLACDWISYKVSFKKMTSLDANVAKDFDWDISQALLCDDYNINDVGGDYVLSLFKSEILKYNINTKSFMVESNLRGTVNVGVNITGDAMLLGWCSFDTQLRLMKASATVANSNVANDQTYYAWVEKEYTRQVKADTTTSGVVSGYGDVKYTISTPFGDGAETNFVFDKSTKSYGSITLSATSKLTLVATKNNKVNHLPYSISYATGLVASESNQMVTMTAYGYVLSPTILVCFDASSTITQVLIVSGNQTVKTELDLYGGYSITYNKVNNTMKVVIKDFWNNLVTINKNADYTYLINYENGTGLTDNYDLGILYPRANYKIISLQEFSANTLEVEKTKITTTLTNGKDASGTTNYIGDNQKYVVKYEELVQNVYVTYHLNVTDEIEQTNQEYLGLNPDVGYVHYTSTTSYEEYGNGFRIMNIQKRTGSLQYAGLDAGIELQFGSILGYVRAGRNASTDKLYELTGVVIKNGVNEVASANTVSAKNDFEITEDSYDIYISVRRVTTVKIYFKSTLPYKQDLANMFIKCVNITGKMVDFNNKNVAVEWDLAKDGVPLIFEQSGKLVIASRKGSSERVNSRIIISYGNRIGDYKYTDMYDIDGWYIDDTLSHQTNIQVETKKIGDYEYILNTFNNANPVQTVGASDADKLTNGYAVNRDCTIVLSAHRKPVKLRIDNNTWFGVDKNKLDESNFDVHNLKFTKTLDDAVNQGYLAFKKSIEECLASAKKVVNATTILLPSGLIKLVPSDYNSQIEETLYYTPEGDNAFMYQSDGMPNILNRNIRGGTFTLSIKGVDEVYYQVNISGLNENSLGGFVIYESDKFDTHLISSDSYTLAGFPITKYATFNFYPKAYGEKDNEATSFKLAGDALTLFRTFKKDSVRQATFYIAKDDKYNNYVGLSSAKMSSSYKYYKNAAITFEAGSVYEQSSDFNCMLTGYKITDAEGKVLFSSDKTDKVSFNETKYSPYSTYDFAFTADNSKVYNVYPVFERVKIFKITFADKMKATNTDYNQALISGATYTVFEGDTFNWESNLSSVTLNFINGDVNVLTASVGKYPNQKILKGLNIITTQESKSLGIINIIQYISDNMSMSQVYYGKQTDNEHGDIYGGLSGKTFKLSFVPTQDMTITPVLEQLGVVVKYDVSDVLAKKKGLNISDLANEFLNLNKTRYYYNMPRNARYRFNQSLISSDYSKYFTITGYSTNKSKTISTYADYNYNKSASSNSVIIQKVLSVSNNTVTFYVYAYHPGTDHDYVQTDFGYKSSTSCVRYYIHTCKFCDVWKWGNKTGFVLHDDNPNTYYTIPLDKYEDYNKDQHYHYYKCNRCGDQNGKELEKHNFIKDENWTHDGKIHYKYNNCTKCYKKVQVDLAQHSFPGTGAHYKSEAATCYKEGFVTNNCPVCSYVDTRKIPKSSHICEDVVKLIPGNCTYKGTLMKKCKWYNGVECKKIDKRELEKDPNVHYAAPIYWSSNNMWCTYYHGSMFVETFVCGYCAEPYGCIIQTYNKHEKQSQFTFAQIWNKIIGKDDIVIGADGKQHYQAKWSFIQSTCKVCENDLDRCYTTGHFETKTFLWLKKEEWVVDEEFWGTPIECGRISILEKGGAQNFRFINYYTSMVVEQMYNYGDIPQCVAGLIIEYYKNPPGC